MSDEIAELIIRSSRTESLQKQNDSLRAQLADALLSARNDADSFSKDTTEAAEHADYAPVPYADYARLAKKFNELKENEKVYAAAIEHYQQQSRNLKQQVRQWDEYKAYRERHGLSPEFKSSVVSAQPNGTSTPTSNPPISRPQWGIAGKTLTPSDSTPLARSARLSKPLEDDQELQPPIAADLNDENLELTPREQTRHDQAAPEMIDNAKTASGINNMTTEKPSETHEIPRLPDQQVVPEASSYSARINSSQTTEDEPAVSNIHNVGTQDDDDMPVFVSSRPVRRSRNHSRQQAQQDCSMATDSGPIKIKEESSTGSSPIRISSQKRLERTETMDLDVVGLDFKTPRKRQRLDRHRTTQRNGPRRAVSANPLFQQPPDVAAPIKCEPGLDDHTFLNDDAPMTLTRSNSDSQLHDENFASRQRIGALSSKLDPKRSRKRSKDEAQTLHQLDPNERSSPRGPLPKSNSLAVEDNSRDATLIRKLAEDGDSQLQVRKRSRKSKSSSRSPAQQAEGLKRLQVLLETDTPQKQTLSALPTPPATKVVGTLQRPWSAFRVSGRSSGSPALHGRPTATLKQSNSLAVSFGSFEQRRSEQRKDEAQRPRQKRATRLRERRIEDLKVSDFKLNPNYIGHHLPMDVVRDQDTRRCLPGCTRECCRGAFRAMAEAGLMANPSRSLFDSSPPEDDNSPISEEDHRVLKQHLGDAYSREGINSKSKAELDELVLQARTRLIADQYGRHKRIWERPKTPPGYWRTGMPSTQELEEDREKARVMERERVQEMRDDAMRGGGRWIFRDEQ